jgi:hypothetical protein
MLQNFSLPGWAQTDRREINPLALPSVIPRMMARNPKILVLVAETAEDRDFIGL